MRQIRKIYEIFHNCQSTELFYQHVKNYNDITTTELILDTTFEWEIFEGHCSSKVEAIDCIFDHLEDKQLKNWIFEILSRGIVYSIQQKFIGVIDVLETFWKFISVFVRMFFFYFDIYKDILAFVVFDHISKFEATKAVSY